MAVMTEEWARFPFSFDGRDYVSRVKKDTQTFETISKLPEGLFEVMNIQCLRELMGEGRTLSEAKKVLDKINEHGSYAFIELA